MLRFIAHNCKRAGAKGSPRAQLHLERLEGRDCPSPVLVNVDSRLIGTTLVVTGQVQDTTPANDQVSLSGAVSGTAHILDAQGDFAFISASAVSPGSIIQVTASTPPSGGSSGNSLSAGNVYSSGSGGSNNGSNASETFLVNAPTGAEAPYIMITGITYGHQRSITITGIVAAENPAGLTVNISGVASGSTETDAEGNFSITLTASGLGNVDAQTEDANGESNVASEALSVPPPQIDSLTCAEGDNNSFVIRGHVNCQDPQGLTVNFGGEVIALDGQQATVGADGWFEIIVTVPPNDNGTFTAQVTDYWGQQSNLMSGQLNHSN